MTISEGAMLVFVVLIAWSLYKAHKDRNGLSTFSLFDLVQEHGRVSKTAFVFMGAFGGMTWIMVQLTIGGKMSEGYMGLYGATFVAPILTKMLATRDQSPPANTTEISKTETVKTTEVKQ